MELPYPPSTHHLPTIYPPPIHHLSTIYPPSTHHLSTIYSPPTHHLPTIYLPSTHHLSTIYPPPTHHLSTIYPPSSPLKVHWQHLSAWSSLFADLWHCPSLRFVSRFLFVSLRLSFIFVSYFFFHSSHSVHVSYCLKRWEHVPSWAWLCAL